MQRLSEIGINQQCVIIAFDDSILRHNKKYVAGYVESRLLEMGFIEGARIIIVHMGVFGKEPIAVRINDNNNLIALRKEEASIIIVSECV